MYNGLRIGATGMKSSQKVMDNVSDQIANVNTTGYKKREVVFKDLLRNEVGKNHVMVSENAGNVSIGAGSRGEIVKTNFTQGAITPSEGSFHMALEGGGFFGVRVEGNEAYIGITDFAQEELGDIVFIDITIIFAATALQRLGSIISSFNYIFQGNDARAFCFSIKGTTISTHYFRNITAVYTDTGQ